MTTAQILIVDDELNIPIFLKDLLERAGYQVILASGGEDALARAARLAGVHRGPFYKLLQKYTLDPEAFRKGTGPL